MAFQYKVYMTTLLVEICIQLCSAAVDGESSLFLKLLKGRLPVLEGRLPVLELFTSSCTFSRTEQEADYRETSHPHCVTSSHRSAVDHRMKCKYCRRDLIGLPYVMESRICRCRRWTFHCSERNARVSQHMEKEVGVRAWDSISFWALTVDVATVRALKKILPFLATLASSHLQSVVSPLQSNITLRCSSTPADTICRGQRYQLNNQQGCSASATRWRTTLKAHMDAHSDMKGEIL